MTMYLKQFHLVSLSSMPVCAFYCRCILHESLEFLAISSHCLQNYQLEFIDICLNLVLLLSFILFCSHSGVCCFVSFCFVF